MSAPVVIGSSGYLGSRLAAALGRDHPVLTVAHSDARAGLVAELLCERDVERLIDACRGRVVYYCANIGGRAAADAAPREAARVNSDVPARIAAVAAKFVYYSSDYAYSRPGSHGPDAAVSPDGVYARTKTDGEMRVRHAAHSALIIRVSGLYDDNGTRTTTFGSGLAMECADNRVTTPTYVPDAIDRTRGLIRGGHTGTHHVVGPVALSDYEFHQIASLRHGMRIRPVLAPQARHDIAVLAEADLTTRHPCEVFAPPASADPAQVQVFDTVGVVLGGRSWKYHDPQFWADQENGHTTRTPEFVADLYGPNWALWSQVCRARGFTILANNGPSASFELWSAKYGLDRIFDLTLNSERDRVTKPDAGFLRRVDTIAAGRPVRLLDDRADIIDAARRHGWSATRTVQVSSWPTIGYTHQRRTAS